MIHTLIDVISWIAIVWLFFMIIGCFATITYLLFNTIKEWLDHK